MSLRSQNIFNMSFNQLTLFSQTMTQQPVISQGSSVSSSKSQKPPLVVRSIPFQPHDTYAIGKRKPITSRHITSAINENTNLPLNISDLIRLYSEDEQAFRLCHEPYEFYKEIAVAKRQLTNFRLPNAPDGAFIFLSLCPCEKMNAELRELLENRSIDLLSQSHPKGAFLTIISVGTGGAYQELVYLAKLARAGYQEIHLIAIDPATVMLGALAGFCEEHVTTCNMEFVQYKSLEEYVKAVEHPKPDLLLLLDLTDEKYKIKGQTLTDYAFDLFKKNDIVKPGTVIAYSNLEILKEQSKARFISKAVCCSYDGTSKGLSDINLNRKEFVSASE